MSSSPWANSEVVDIFHAARSANRFEALEPARQGVHRCFDPSHLVWRVEMMLRHDHVVPIAGQSWIGRVAIGNQRGSALHVGLRESFDRPGGIVGDHGKADAARTCIEVFGVLASRPSSPVMKSISDLCLVRRL